MWLVALKVLFSFFHVHQDFTCIHNEYYALIHPVLHKQSFKWRLKNVLQNHLIFNLELKPLISTAGCWLVLQMILGKSSRSPRQSFINRSSPCSEVRAWPSPVKLEGLQLFHISIRCTVQDSTTNFPYHQFKSGRATNIVLKVLLFILYSMII